MPPLMPMDLLGMAQAHVGGRRGRHFWRALEELADDETFRAGMAETMPQWATLAPLDRRGFLRLLGASLALAGLGGCSGPPPEQIVPSVRGRSGEGAQAVRFYATTVCCGGDATGVLVETHDGRPTKIEGNPDHPASLGATGRLPQALVLELWDPDRSTHPVRAGVPATWDAFAGELARWRERFGERGEGLRILSGELHSPTLRAQRAALLSRFPAAQWHVHEPAGRGQSLAGARQAFGRACTARYDVAAADVLVMLDADLLDGMPGHLAYARAFASRRRPDRDGVSMNRLYVAEPTPTLTGSVADHRWPLGSAQVGALALQLAQALGVVQAPASGATVDLPLPGRVLTALVDDLSRHRGHALVVAGETQPPVVHALVHLINQALGNVGRTVDYVDPHGDADAPPPPGLAALVVAMGAGQVDTLLLLDTNPVYTAPADVDFAAALGRVPHTVHLGLYRDESGQRCGWHLPMAHALEAWSDARAFDGTASIVQPVLAPLYGGRSMHELVALLAGAARPDGRAIVRAHWADAHERHLADEAAWDRALRDGVIAGTRAPALDVTASLHEVGGSLSALAAPAAGRELLFRPDPTVDDGRYANNGWLQELPKPPSQLTWGNVALVAPALAEREGLANGDVVALRCGDRQVDAPVWITPGQAEASLTVHLGYGRRHAGRVGDGLGFDAYALRSAGQPWTGILTGLARTGRHAELAGTQRHFSMEGRDLVRTTSLDGFRDDPSFAQGETPPSLYPPQPGGRYAWGMTIDLNSCIGCKGCTIACQAENNIPVVGAEEVRRGREMHWIRVDRYYEGTPQAPATHHQPVPCMHCEHAPCELVCPVGATVHDAEGLNVQVYNRCVGTRFCSNNCPYKVRRFNFLQYSDLQQETLKAQRNPEVTVRNRGVMEKCTYCIQRIEVAHIAADREGRAIADGEVVTACQAACPTQAIRFGDLLDADSAVSREKASPLNYVLLEERNTRPRTSYLAQVRNPHPALEDEA